MPESPRINDNAGFSSQSLSSAPGEPTEPQIVGKPEAALQIERAASSNASFGAVLLACLALAALTGLGVYYFSFTPPPQNLAANNTTGSGSARAATVTTPAPSASFPLQDR